MHGSSDKSDGVLMMKEYLEKYRYSKEAELIKKGLTKENAKRLAKRIKDANK